MPDTPFQSKPSAVMLLESSAPFNLSEGEFCESTKVLPGNDNDAGLIKVEACAAVSGREVSESMMCGPEWTRAERRQILSGGGLRVLYTWDVNSSEN